MEGPDQNRCIVAGGHVAAVAEKTDSEEKLPPYLKLNADCWEHIFDYLSFDDIFKLSKTCKRMNRMAGYYFREYYPQLKFKLEEDEVRCKDVCLQTDFYQFISRLYIKWDNNYNVSEFMTNIDRFDALKAIEIGYGELTVAQVENMQNVLKNVESIFVNRCQIVGNIFEQFSNFCPNLKRMFVASFELNGTLVFSQYYPKLEYFRWMSHSTRVAELKTFLEKHLKLKQIHIRSEFLWANRDILIETNIQLDLLNVRYDNWSTVPFDEFIEFLKILYDRNFYKTLKLAHIDSIDNIDRDHMSHAISSLPRLEKLRMTDGSHLDLSRLTNLQTYTLDFFTNIETLAKGLPRLEQLVLWMADIEMILPFIRHSTKLKTIKIKNLCDGFLDLAALNKQRKKLPNACQVSIYVHDTAYLHPKWKSHNLKLELDLVKINRSDTFPSFFNE